jgi:hypothetical protein
MSPLTSLVMRSENWATVSVHRALPATAPCVSVTRGWHEMDVCLDLLKFRETTGPAQAAETALLVAALFEAGVHRPRLRSGWAVRAADRRCRAEQGSERPPCSSGRQRSSRRRPVLGGCRRAPRRQTRSSESCRRGPGSSVSVSSDPGLAPSPAENHSAHQLTQPSQRVRDVVVVARKQRFEQ